MRTHVIAFLTGLCAVAHPGRRRGVREFLRLGARRPRRRTETNCSVNWKDPKTGKIYCFSNEQTKMLFLQDPEENISRAEDAFAKLQKGR